MNDVRTGTTASRGTLKYFRLPLLLVTGLMTLGSGMGNPGCGTGDSGPACDDGCYVEGTWRMTYADTSPLPPGCLAEDVVTPPESVTLNRFSSDLMGHAGDLVLRGSYYGRGNLNLYVWADRQGNSGTAPEHRYYIDGELSKKAERPGEPLTWTGTFKVLPETGGGGTCLVERAFTATR